MKWDTHVFSVGGVFGARLWFDDSKRLFRTEVAPMAYLGGESGGQVESEPRLAESDCDSLISKLSELLPIGTYEWGGLGYSGAGSTQWTRKFGQAYVRLAQREYGYVGFEVLYVLDWSGKVDWKHENQRDSSERYDVIGVGKERFLVSAEESRKLQVGRQSKFLGARDSMLSYDKHGRHKPI